MFEYLYLYFFSDYFIIQLFGDEIYISLSREEFLKKLNIYFGINTEQLFDDVRYE